MKIDLHTDVKPCLSYVSKPLINLRISKYISKYYKRPRPMTPYSGTPVYGPR